MRYRLIATYLGAPYQASFGPDGDEVTLFAACPPPEELGFSSAAGHWRKLVGLADLDALRQSRPVGQYRGARCLVLDDQGDRLHIAYLGHDAVQGRQLGYWEIDRDVFEMVVPRTDVTDLTEEQLDIPPSAAAIPVPPASPPMTAPSVSEPPLSAPPLPAPPLSGSPLPGSPPTGPMLTVPPLTAPPLTAPPLAASQPIAPPPPPHSDPLGYSNGHHTPDRVAAWHGSPEPWVPRESSGNESAEDPGRQHATMYNGGMQNGSMRNGSLHSGSMQDGPRTTRRDRIPIQSVFAELLDLAAIPQAAYAVDDEVPGAMCLLKVEGGFEVFASSDDARLEVRFFEDEEAAYFSLFGVLAAEAVRNGHLGPTVAEPGHTTRTGPLENVSKYLRERNCPNSPRSPVRVLNSRRG